jgi:hypothetical protein
LVDRKKSTSRLINLSETTQPIHPIDVLPSYNRLRGLSISFQKGGAMVVILEMGKLMDQHITDAVTRVSNQVRVQNDLTCWRTTSQLA